MSSGKFAAGGAPGRGVPASGSPTPPLALRSPDGAVRAGGGGGGQALSLRLPCAPGGDRTRSLPLLFNLCPARRSVLTYFPYEKN